MSIFEHNKNFLIFIKYIMKYINKKGKQPLATASKKTGVILVGKRGIAGRGTKVPTKIKKKKIHIIRIILS